MAITVIETAGATNANSYASVAECDTYHEHKLYSTDWSGATEENQKAALVWATRLLDEQMVWVKTKTAEAQSLAWPRDGVYNPEAELLSSSEIPTFLKNAACEFARWLLAGDRTEENEENNYHELKIGDLKLKPRATGKTPIIPPIVYDMIKFYGYRRGSRKTLTRV